MRKPLRLATKISSTLTTEVHFQTEHFQTFWNFLFEQKKLFSTLWPWRSAYCLPLCTNYLVMLAHTALLSPAFFYATELQGCFSFLLKLPRPQSLLSSETVSRHHFSDTKYSAWRERRRTGLFGGWNIGLCVFVWHALPLHWISKRLPSFFISDLSHPSRICKLQSAIHPSEQVTQIISSERATKGLVLPVHPFPASTCSAILLSQPGLLCSWTGRSQVLPGIGGLGQPKLEMYQEKMQKTQLLLTWFSEPDCPHTGQSFKDEFIKNWLQGQCLWKPERIEFLWMTNWNECATSRDGGYLTNRKIETGKLDVKKYISIHDKGKTTRKRETGHREENVTKLILAFTSHFMQQIGCMKFGSLPSNWWCLSGMGYVLR